MLCSTSLLSFLLLATLAYSAPVVEVRDSRITLPIARRLNLGGATLADLDRIRAAHHIEAEKDIGSSRQKFRRQSSFEVTNVGNLYTTDVGVGSPLTNYSLLIDTASSNTWVGANKTFIPTSSSQITGRNVSITYSGSESFEGIEYLDTVTLSPELVITNQSVVVASKSNGLDGMDGILGLGPVGLTSGHVEGNGTIPTVTNSLFTQGTIEEEVLSIFFAPTTEVPATNGYLTFGGVDTSIALSDVSYVPITDTFPSSRYWGVNQSITYGATGESILPNVAGMIDSGTSLLLLPTSAFNKYASLTGATVDNSTGLLKISSTDYNKLESLFFHIGDQTYEFTANAQIFPRSLNADINGTADAIYLIISDIGDDSDSGLSFVNGYVFLERFYSVYDTTNNRVGLATTEYTYYTCN